jgi:hypothetical protein
MLAVPEWVLVDAVAASAPLLILKVLRLTVWRITLLAARFSPPARGQEALAPVLRAHVLVLRVSKLAQVPATWRIDLGVGLVDSCGVDLGEQVRLAER